MAQIVDVPNYGAVEFPDDMTDEQIVAAIKKNGMGYKSPAVTSSRDRFIRGMVDPIDAGAQMLEKAVPDSVRNIVNSANNWVAEKTGLVAPVPQGGITEMIQQKDANYVAPEGIDWARMGGNVASPANLAVASKVPAAASLAGRIGYGAAGGAAMGALQPVTQGDFAEEKAKQMAVGGVAGGAIPMFTGAAARIVSPNASSNANVAALKAEGITPTIGQSLGGWANRAEQKLMSVPVLGDMISGARTKANASFERAAFNRALKPVGQKLPEDLSGREALSFTQDALSTQYDDVLGKIGAISVDGNYKMKVASLNGMVNKIKDQKAKQSYQMALKEVYDNIDQNGVITSEAYKAIESNLGKYAQKLGSSDDIFQNKAGDAVKQLQAELRDMLKRQAGPYADDLAKSNQAWANFKRVQRAAASLGADEGSFTPAQLQNAVKALDKSKDKARFAEGNALMQDLTDAGKAVLGSNVPNSGTVDRLLLGGGALGSYLIDPVIPAGIAGSSLLYTSPAQKALVGAVTSRPQSAKAIANAVRKSSPYLLPISPGLLNYQQQ